MSQPFNPRSFVETEIVKMRRDIGKKKALVAVSGGVDSVTSAVMTYRAIGKNLICVILDDAFMREKEPEQVADVLSRPPFNVPIRIVNVRERFLNAMKDLRDAEEKRKVFRETFYEVLGETARNEKCEILVQGTIRADVIETVGGVKTQHNVLNQMGIDSAKRFGFRVVEPLVTLLKGQVRMVARYFGLPVDISERQPFPGPGLSVRVVGEIRDDKLKTVKTATAVVEHELAELKPSQYFAVIVDNREILQQSRVAHFQELAARVLNVPSRNVHVKVFENRATGVHGGKRVYGEILGIEVKKMNGSLHRIPIKNIASLQARIITGNPNVTRVFLAVKDLPEKKPYVIGIRSVQTEDFLTAEVSQIPWSTLSKISEGIISKCPTVSTVYFDVTPKPPATIEME